MQTSSTSIQIITQKPFKYNDGMQKLSPSRIIALVIAGVFIGAINGLFGAGGGMLLVPALSTLARLEQKKAHATAIALILPLCLISSIAYALGTSFDYTIILPTVIGVTLGGIIGALLLKRLSDNTVGFVFYALMLFAGFKMLL